MESEPAVQPDIPKPRRVNLKKLLYLLIPLLLISLAGGYFLFTQGKIPLFKRTPTYWKTQMCLEIRTEDGVGSSQVTGKIVRKAGNVLTIDSVEGEEISILVPAEANILRSKPSKSVSEMEAEEISFEQVDEGDHALIVFSSDDSSEGEEKVKYIFVSEFPIFNECE